MKSKLAIVMGFLIAVVVIIVVAVGRRGDAKATPDRAPDTPRASTGKTVEVVLEYSTEKKEWLEAAIAELEKAEPNIRVKLVGRGSLDSVQSILDGQSKPTLWSPADSLIANLLAADWQTKHGTSLFVENSEQPLLLSPLVYAVWEDRADVLIDHANGQLSWKPIHKAVSSPKGWPAIGGKPGWGFVKLGHTDPNRSNSGVQALVLMAHEYFGTRTLTVEQMLDPKFQEFVKEIESGVTRFEATTGTFMTDMIRFGPSKYDIAVVYESLAVSQLANAQGRWGSLHIYYPPVTIWSDHPVVLLDAPWVTDEQKKAARTVIEHLLSRPIQATALRHGFRPADTTVPMKGPTDAANLFSKMAPYGLTLDLPPAARPADGAVVRNLLMMWSRVVKK